MAFLRRDGSLTREFKTADGFPLSVGDIVKPSYLSKHFRNLSSMEYSVNSLQADGKVLVTLASLLTRKSVPKFLVCYPREFEFVRDRRSAPKNLDC